jgi:hypothetical protein
MTEPRAASPDHDQRRAITADDLPAHHRHLRKIA